MLGNKNYNAPLTTVVLANNVGKTAPSVTSTGYIAVNGIMYGPMAGTEEASLVNFSVSAGNYAVFSVYAKSDFTLNVTKSAEYTNSTALELANISKEVRCTEDIPTRRTGLVITSGTYVRYNQNFYLCSSTHTAGATLDITKLAIAIQPDSVSKAYIGSVIIKNAAATTFVGGTTLLDAANVTTIYVPCAPVTLQ
jgi:hypothetical protein